MKIRTQKTLSKHVGKKQNKKNTQLVTHYLSNHK